MEKLYYYKRMNTGDYVFPDGQILEDRAAMKKLIAHREKGGQVWRLYLDIQEDYEKIKSMFFTPEYWADKEDWRKEAAL